MSFTRRNSSAPLLIVLSVLLAACAAGALAQSKKQQPRQNENSKPQAQSEKTQDETRPLTVKLNVSVMNSANRPAASLNSEDFQVLEDDVPQAVTSFKQQAAPLSYGLLIDSSGSLRSQIQKELDIAQDIISTAKPEDEAFLIRFVSVNNIQLLQDWTSNRAQLKRAMNEIYPEGGESAITDAIYTAAQHIAERSKQESSPRRHALILITDGDERASYYKFEQLLKLLHDTDIQIFAIGFVDQIENRNAREKAINFLQTLASETGGRVFLDGRKPDAPQTDDWSDRNIFVSDWKLNRLQIATEITQELNAQYLISYNSTNKKRNGSFRKVQVTIKEAAGRDKLTALTRAGYTAPDK